MAELPEKTPDQALYDAVFAAAQALGYDTYDHNPPKDTPYPFVHVCDVHLLPRATKCFLLATVSIQVDVWGNGGDRRQISNMAHQLMRQASFLKALDNGLAVSMNRGGSDVVVMSDNSTGEDLWRARLSMEFDVY